MTEDTQLIRARFSKSVQPKQYESESAEIETTFTAIDAAAGTEQDAALAACRAAVYKVLGLTTTQATNKASPVVENVASKASPQAETPKTEEKAPSKRGRPSAAEVAAKLAKAAADKALADADPMSDVLTEASKEDAKPNISTGDERVDVDPMDDVIKTAETATTTFSMEDETTASDAPISDQDLQNEAGRSVQRLGDPNIIRAMVRTNYRVAKLDEVEQKYRKALVSDLKNLQKDGSIKKADK